MDHNTSDDFDELQVLRAKISTLEMTINQLAFSKAQAETSHELAIAAMQERINGWCDAIHFDGSLNLK